MAWSEKPFGEIMHGIPHRQETYNNNGEEYNDNIVGVNTHGIGVDYERTARPSQSYYTVGLLQPTEKQSDGYTDDSSDDRNHASLEEENAYYLAVARSKVAQCHHIVALVYNEHGETAYDVEASHDEYERQENVSH